VLATRDLALEDERDDLLVEVCEPRRGLAGIHDVTLDGEIPLEYLFEMLGWKSVAATGCGKERAYPYDAVLHLRGLADRAACLS
jgi:hypothetical protein